MRTDGKSGGTTLGDKSKASILGRLKGITRKALGDGKADSPRNTKNPRRPKGKGKKGFVHSDNA